VSMVKSALLWTFSLGVFAILLWFCFAAAEWGGLYGYVGCAIGAVVGWREWRAVRDNKRLSSVLFHSFVGTWIGLMAGGLLSGALVSD
jgi:hypothetical protein